MSDEELVRSFWERVLVCDGSYRGYPRDTILINYDNHTFYDFDSWSDAAIFTRDRQDRISEKKEELDLIRHLWGNDWAWVNYEAVERISILLNYKLAELLVGVKEK